MAWIESHQALATHRKLKRLAKSLDISRVTAIGHLHLLWWWALDNAPDGDVSDLATWEIADAAAWDGDPDQFVECMVAAGFIDETEQFSRLHDWNDYAGKLVARRESDAARKRSARHPTDIQRTSNGHPTDIAGTADGRPTDGVRTQHNRTVHNPTQQNSAGENARARNDISGSPQSTTGSARPLPPEWEPTDTDWREACETYGYTEDQAKAETRKFCDRARATGRKMVDWNADWRMWMSRNPPSAPAGRPLARLPDVRRSSTDWYNANDRYGPEPGKDNHGAETG